MSIIDFLVRNPQFSPYTDRLVTIDSMLGRRESDVVFIHPQTGRPVFSMPIQIEVGDDDVYVWVYEASSPLVDVQNRHYAALVEMGLEVVRDGVVLTPDQWRGRMLDLTRSHFRYQI
ncbi:MAG: hypothetical protein SFU83_08400 [Meiothermus sp.]|nr:hypothetical protein [Meiothermus sp.]